MKLANVAAIVATPLAGMTWLESVDLYVRIAAGLVAIVAGLCAAWYHWKKAKAL